ncbi:TolC family protein [Myroides sp. N17-2]|uniref:TolC family protein n=1 Tax=Myroides sp. N17-2 TaxID=2030799 RepID=UPI000EFBB9B7|nr:TolC family protein [Myroides sp. N17-2]
MKRNIVYIATALTLLSSVNGLYAQKNKLTLSDALEMAKEGNKTLQMKILEEINTKEITKETKNGFLPTISANAGYSYYINRQVIFLPGSFAGSTKPVQDITVGGKNVYNAYVSLYQPIIAPNKLQQVKIAKLNEQLESEKTADLSSRVAYNVSLHYLDMLMMNRQLDLLEESLQRNKRALKDSRSLYEQGRGLKSDTLRSSIAVSNLKSSVSYLKSTIDVSAIELKRLIGTDDLGEIELTDNLDLGEKSNVNDLYQIDEAIEIAQKNRKELIIQQLSINLQEKKTKIIQAEQLPQLSLVGQYQVQAQEDNMDFGQYVLPRTSYLGVQLTVPVFSGNRIKSQINQSKIKTQQEKIRLDDLNEKVKTELSTILNKQTEGYAQLQIQQNTVELAALNQQMIEDRFKNGLGSRLELTDAELALTQAKISYLNAIYNLRILDLELRFALGLISL